MDIQPVLSEFKAATYMYKFFKKIQDQFSQAIKQALKETFKNSMIIMTPRKQILKPT